MLLCLPAIVGAQTGGLITGRVTDALNGGPIPGAEVTVDAGGQGSLTDAEGRYVIRDVLAGYRRVSVRAVGFKPLVHDSVLVGGGRTAIVDFELAPEAVELPGVAVEATPDRLLDPREPQTIYRVNADELRGLPVTSLEEALELQAGVVQGSFRGGRIGQEALVVDGLAFKNQLDASSGEIGIRIPTIAVEEASVVTNGFSARYGQALSGILTASIRDGGDWLEGRVAVETDRSLPEGWNVGLDRVTASIGGPIVGPLRFFVALDAQARIDDDPVNAPAPSDSLDPRSAQPYLLPHNSGEQFDALAKLTFPLGRQEVIRVLGLVSESQRRLFDQQLKYATQQGPGQRISGRLGMVHFRRTSSPQASTTLNVDFRAGYYEKEAIRAPLLDQYDPSFGGFTFSRFEFAGESVARSRDTVAAQAPLPGFQRPEYVDNTPWGVPAFFTTTSERGEIAWNRFREGRFRLDVLVGPGSDTDIRLGAEYVKQHVETFTRLEAYRAVDQGAPAPTTAAFSPYQGSGYVELIQRAAELTLTAGLRADVYNGQASEPVGVSKTQLALGPRLAVSTALGPAIVVVSWGRFAQPPDFQYMVDAAWDDTTRTSRFRRGNPGVGFETANQYEFQLRARPSPNIALRVGAYVKQLDGLIASIPFGVDPDSAIFGNGDYGNVKGLEFTVEREFRGAFGFRATYVLQKADASASDARDLYGRLQITPVGDTILPATAEYPLDYDRRHSLVLLGRVRLPSGFGRILAGTELGAVGRWGSGLPYSKTTPTGDSLIGLPNTHRLPSQATLDLFLRRMFGSGRTRLGVFVDLRNVTNHQNVLAVRRDSGEPNAAESQIEAMAQAAYQANSAPIPYESQRYRSWADLNRDGTISGPTELLPLYERAARDVTQPLFYYGNPRLIRIGAELFF